jgi:ParB family transcriptional regulator, chromosome partitioning protein
MLTRTTEKSANNVKAAKAAHAAITLAAQTSSFFALHMLVLSPDNVRKTTSADGIAELAELIYSQGLLVALHVVPELIDGRETGRYEVVAGGRRLRAMQLLVKQGRLEADSPVECKVVCRDHATEVSMAENSGHEAMHPADEFEAFRKMVDEGRSIEDVAARFGVTVKSVQRRLKLANVAPVLLAQYRQGKATLDQMQALAATDDQEHQVAVWNSLDSYQRHAHTLRNRLLIEEVLTTDARVKFVGLNSYKAAGGTTRLDLFSPKEQTYLTDVPLLDLLLAEKLDAEAEAIRAEGWRWVDVRARFDYSDKSAFTSVRPAMREPTKAEASAIAAVERKIAANEQAWEEDETNQYERFEAESERLDTELSALRASLLCWTDECKAVAGVVVTLENGVLTAHRGLVRAEDRKASRGLDVSQGEGDRPAKVKPEVPEKLMLSLTSHRTLALQAALLDNQHVAIASLAHTLLLSSRHCYTDSCVKVSLKDSRDRAESLAAGAADGRAAKVLDAAAQRWSEALPEDEGQWYTWLLAQSMEVLLDLLTYLTAQSIDAIQGREREHFQQSDELAEALALDMAEWWEATPDTYLQAVPKAKLIEAVTQAVDAKSGEPIAAMKKDAAVAAAAMQLHGKRWLPKPLRRKQREEVAAE